MFNSYGSPQNGAYAPPGQPNQQLNYPPQYPQYQQPPPAPAGATQPQTHYHISQYSNNPALLPPQRSPQYMNQYQSYQTYNAPSIAPPQQQLQPQYYPQHIDPQQIQRPMPSPQSRAKPTPQASPKSVASAPQNPFPIDFQVLLALADEYVAEARKIAPGIALTGRDDEVAQYYKLMATGMSCMEVVLKVRQVWFGSLESVLNESIET